jgi:hypothetical protein
MVKRYSGGVISATAPLILSNTASGFHNTSSQMQAKKAGVWPIAGGVQLFTISPAVSGKTTWDLAVDGALNLSSNGTYTLTPLNTFTASVKMWGGGGGTGNQNMPGGAGGASTGTVTFSSGIAHVVLVGQGGRIGSGGTALGGGGSGDVYRGGGAGYSGIFRTSQTQNNAVMMAGGGGGSGGGGGAYGAGAGGGSSGQAGNAGQGSQPGGGTQLAGGAATGASGSVSGAALTGANGLSGGGGGYFGGASGGDSGPYAPGAGGGSGYLSNTYVTAGQTLTGNLTTTGNSTDADRGTSGAAAVTVSTAGTDGRIYISI